MALSILSTISTNAIAAVIGDDYPYKDKVYGRYNLSLDVDPWNYFYRECTSFVAWRLNNTNGIAFHNKYEDKAFGNAGTWRDAAISMGLTVDYNPAVGSVAVTKLGSPGHVAWVAEVNGDNVTIEEYNFNGNHGRYNRRTISRYQAEGGYIHFKDLAISRPDTSAEIPDGVYSLQHKSSGKFISTGLSNENGGNTYLWEWANNNDQKFKFERQEDNTYKITSLYSGKVLDVYNQQTQDGANVHQWEWWGGNNQKWYIISSGGGYYKLIAQHSGRALDVHANGSANNTNIHQWEDDNSDRQKFILIPQLLPATSANIANGEYSVQHKSSNKYISAGRLVDDGISTKLWEWTDNNDQIFIFERQPDNTYSIKSKYSNKVLDVGGISLERGADVVQYLWNGLNNQRWYIVYCGNGYYKFIAKHSGQALDVHANGSANGTNIHQWTDDGSDRQKFKLIVQDLQFTPLIADLNDDGFVNTMDIALITSSTYWLKTSKDTGYDIKIDLNKDGLINALDITVITNPLNWLKSG